MKHLSRIGVKAALFCILAVVLLHPWHLQAQSPDIHLELEIDEQLRQSQRLDFTWIGVDGLGGDPVGNVLIENLEDHGVDNLFLYKRVEASGIGTLVELHQNRDGPFSLQPGQVTMADFNQLEDGLPGVQEQIRFEDDPGLTPEGDEFLRDLEGTTRLPRKVYTLTVGIYRDANRLEGGEELAKVSASFGADALGGFDDSIYLLSPGDVLGSSDAVIHTTRPFFLWEGDVQDEYRLVVVEDTGDDAETLIQNAISDDPVVNSDTPGSYLDYEMADAVITNATNFTYPSSDVRGLEEGQRYFWQVFINVSTSSGEESIESEVFEFTVQDPHEDMTDATQQEILRLLEENLTGEELEKLRRMIEEDFTVGAIELGGEQYTGQQILGVLEELFEKESDGDITFSN